MSNDELQPKRQGAGNDRSLRLRILLEISCVCPLPGAQQRAMVAESEAAEWSRRDVNLTMLARRIESLFSQRWPAGLFRRQRAAAAYPDADIFLLELR